MLHAGSLEGPVPVRVPVEAWALARPDRPHVAPLAGCRAVGADAHRVRAAVRGHESPGMNRPVAKPKRAQSARELEASERVGGQLVASSIASMQSDTFSQAVRWIRSTIRAS